jgi:hypothetical protein
MPVLRYFVFVGAALLALLFVVAEAFPVLPTAQNGGVTDTAAADVPMIRIHTDRKWPERVVFDTSAPTIIPATVAAVPVPPAPSAVADAGTKVTARDAFAQLTPSDLKKVKPQPKRKIAKGHVAPPPMQVAQRPQFGLFAINLW